MAEKRMFAKSIVSSDAFLDMPISAQYLYFRLGMEADDDGFVGAPKRVMRECKVRKEALDILLRKRFLLSFPSGAVVIKHWRINNYQLRTDRYKPTTYVKELSTLTFDEKKAYTEKAKAETAEVFEKKKVTLSEKNGKVVPKADRLTITLVDGSVWNVPDQFVISYQKRYPDLEAYNVLMEIQTATQIHPQKRPYPQNITGFVTRWFENKLQDLRKQHQAKEEAEKTGKDIYPTNDAFKNEQGGLDKWE